MPSTLPIITAPAEAIHRNGTCTSSLFLDGRDVVIFKDPITNNAKTYRWWADNGMIHSELQTNGDYQVHTVRDILLRLKGIQDMVANSRRQLGGFRASDIREYQNFIDQMVNLCKKAHSHGRPEVEAHATQKASQFKAARQSRMVMIPGMGRSF